MQPLAELPHQKREEVRAYRREYARRHREELREQDLNSYLLRTYGISLEEFERLVAVQRGRCLICDLPPTKGRPHVDHSHATGVVRGLLCNRCNRNLGWVERHLTAIKAYLDA